MQLPNKSQTCVKKLITNRKSVSFEVVANLKIFSLSNELIKSYLFNYLNIFLLAFFIVKGLIHNQNSLKTYFQNNLKKKKKIYIYI